jgi:hypothetical protein
MNNVLARTRRMSLYSILLNKQHKNVAALPQKAVQFLIGPVRPGRQQRPAAAAVLGTNSLIVEEL